MQKFLTTTDVIVLPRFPEQPEKTLNLSHIVPPSPLPSHNGFDSGLLAPFDRSSTLDSRATGRSLDSAGASLNRASTSNDEEHRLIARYAARLAQERTPASSSENASLAPDNSQAQRQLIAQLESKNKEIMREIARLRRQQEAEQLNQESPALMNELRALRQRKGELEVRRNVAGKMLLRYIIVNIPGTFGSTSRLPTTINGAVRRSYANAQKSTNIESPLHTKF